MKKFLNKIRYQYHLSLLAQCLARPVERLCRTIADQLRMKVWVNGRTVHYDGIRITFPRNVGVSYASSIFWNDIDGFEPDTWRVIKHFLDQSTLFIDVGSNIGLYSILARKVNPDLRILSYEPVPSIFNKNIAFHQSNGYSTENIANIAIGDSNGTAEIFLPIVKESMEEQTTATLREDSWQRTKECERYEVAVTTLDQVLAGIGADERVLVKIDVEDFESSVFKGASELMQSVRPIFVCEVLPREHGNQETYDALKAHGYVAFGISNVGLIRFDKNDFLDKRSFRDFLIIPELIAPKVNYLHYASLASIK